LVFEVVIDKIIYYVPTLFMLLAVAIVLDIWINYG